MKLSKLIQTENKTSSLYSMIVHIYGKRYTVVEIFRHDDKRKHPILKIFRTFDVDIEASDVDVSDVINVIIGVSNRTSLGLKAKRIRDIVTKNYYINIYNY